MTAMVARAAPMMAKTFPENIVVLADEDWRVRERKKSREDLVAEVYGSHSFPILYFARECGRGEPPYEDDYSG